MNLKKKKNRGHSLYVSRWRTPANQQFPVLYPRTDGPINIYQGGQCHHITIPYLLSSSSTLTVVFYFMHYHYCLLPFPTHPSKPLLLLLSHNSQFPALSFNVPSLYSKKAGCTWLLNNSIMPFMIT